MSHKYLKLSFPLLLLVSHLLFWKINACQLSTIPRHLLLKQSHHGFHSSLKALLNVKNSSFTQSMHTSSHLVSFPSHRHFLQFSISKTTTSSKTVIFLLGCTFKSPTDLYVGTMPRDSDILVGPGSENFSVFFIDVLRFRCL